MLYFILCVISYVFINRSIVQLYLSLVVVVGVGGGGKPVNATGGHRGQFPRTDFGPFRKSTSLATPPGPLKLR